MMLKKKGVGILAAPIMAVIVIALCLLILIPIGKDTIGDSGGIISDLNNITRGGNFQVYEPELSQEELMLNASLMSLVEAINHVTKYSQTTLSTSSKIESVIVNYQVRYETDGIFYNPNHIDWFSSTQNTIGSTKTYIDHINQNENNRLEKIIEVFNVPSMKLTVTYKEKPEVLTNVEEQADGIWTCEQKIIGGASNDLQRPMSTALADCIEKDTALSCPGIKLYYCGIVTNEENAFFAGHSTSYIKSYLAVEQQEETGETTEVSRTIGEALGITTSCVDETCIVENFTLPQKIEEYGWYHPFSWIAGYGDPSYIIYYEAFPSGPEKYWYVSSLDFISVGLIVGFAAFDVIVPGAKALSGSAKKAMKEGAEETVQVLSQRAVREASEPFFKEVAQFGWQYAFRKSYARETLEVIPALARNSDEVMTVIQRSVHAGDVVQKGTYLPTGRIEIRNKIAEVVERNIDEIPIITEDAKEKAAFSLSEQLRKEATEANEEFYSYVSRIGIDGATHADVDEAIYYRATETLELDYILDVDLRKANINKQVDDAMTFMDDAFAGPLTKEAAQLMTRRMAVKHFFESLVTDSGNLNREALSKAIDDSLLKFTSMSAVDREKVIKEGVHFASDIVDADGALRLFPKTNSLTNDFLDEIASNENAAVLASTITDVGGTSTRGLTKGFIGDSSTYNWLYDLSPVKFAKFPTNPALYPATLPVWMAKTGVKSTAELPGWVMRHRYPIIIGLASYAATNDALMEKYIPIGPNSLGVGRPYPYVDPVSEQLDESAQSYFITNAKHPDLRFYAASPCKANVKVVKSECSCNRQPIGQHYNVEMEGYDLIDAKGITLDVDKLFDNTFLDTHLIQYGYNDFYLPSDDENLQSIKETLLLFDVAAMRDHYPKLLNPNEIHTFEEAKRALYQYQIVRFYEETVSGIHTNGVVGLSDEFWQEYGVFIDTTNMQKVCYQRDMVSNAMSLWDPQNLNTNVYTTSAYTTPCVKIEYEKIPSGFGANYCIDDYPHVQAASWALTGVEIGAAVALTGMSGGLAAPFAIAGTGIASGFAQLAIENKAKWPTTGIEGATGSVPSVENTP